MAREAFLDRGEGRAGARQTPAWRPRIGRAAPPPRPGSPRVHAVCTAGRNPVGLGRQRRGSARLRAIGPAVSIGIRGGRAGMGWRSARCRRQAHQGIKYQQRPDTELTIPRFAVASFKFGQENRSLLLRSCFPHDPAPVQGLTLAGWLSGRAIREQVLCGEWPGMRGVCVECEDKCRPLLYDPDPRMAAPVNPPLVALGQAEPALEIEVVLDLLELARGDEEPGQEAGHQRGHVPANRVPGPLESIDQSLELHSAILAHLRPRHEGRGYLLDVLDVLSDRL